MAYPPPPYADAVCGTYVCGEAICGAWWAYPQSPALLLGGQPPVLTIILGDVIPSAGLKLGAWIPDAAGQFEVPQAGLLLGASLPLASIGYIVSVPDAGLRLGGWIPGYGISTFLTVGPAGLLLGAVLPDQAGLVWMTAIGCEDLALVEDTEGSLVLVGQVTGVVVLAGQTCTPLVLAAAASTDHFLEPEECL